jgi:hypothetical protein
MGDHLGVVLEKREQIIEGEAVRTERISGAAVSGSSLHPVRIVEGNNTKHTSRSARNMIHSFHNREARPYSLFAA